MRMRTGIGRRGARWLSLCVVMSTSRSSSKTKLNSSGSRSSLKEKAKKRASSGINVAMEANSLLQEPDGAEVVAEEVVEQLAWKVLGKMETAELAGVNDPHQIAGKLAAVLGLGQYEESQPEAALVDYYVATYWFAREHKFTDEQTSTLFTITHTLITNLKDHHLSLVDNIQQLRDLLGGVGVSQRSAVQCLTPETARLVVECVTTSLFQHYRLFQFLFEEQQTEQHIELSLPVEVPPPISTHCPPPLDEAIPLQLYEMCLAPRPEQEEQPAEPEETQLDQMSSTLANLTQEEGETLMKVSPEELKAVMNSLTTDTLSAYQTEVLSKLQEKEKTFISRLTKLEQSLT